MAVYVRLADGERVLLDTKKAKLVYEGREIDLTGATLDFYDFDWLAGPGTLGAAGEEGKVLQVRDRFTGLAVEIPMHAESADGIALGLAMNGERGRTRWLKRALPSAWRHAERATA